MSVPATAFADNRSNRFVLVPFCTLAQSFHAEGLVKYDWGGVIKPIIQVLLDRDINIIQMPCMETMYHGGTRTGLNRKPQGMKKYDVPEFREFCDQQARNVVEQIAGIVSNGYEVVAILGMEYSPSCAAKIQYPPKKGFANRGVFMRALVQILDQQQYRIPILGINRRGLGPTIARLTSILDETELEKSSTALGA